TNVPATANEPVPPIVPLKVLVAVLASVMVLAPNSVTLFVNVSGLEPVSVTEPFTMTTGLLIETEFGAVGSLEMLDWMAPVFSDNVPLPNDPLLPTISGMPAPMFTVTPPENVLFVPVRNTGCAPANVISPVPVTGPDQYAPPAPLLVMLLT